MRKAFASTALALMLLGGASAPAVAQTGGEAGQEQTTSEDSDSGKLGLLGLLGLAGLAGLARGDRDRTHDRDRDTDRPRR
jgi:MYXO-CTERM domain-containing protein